MNGFGFSLAVNVALRADAKGYFLISPAPIKLLRLNESLYNILKHIRDGGQPSDFHIRNPQNTTRVLLTLVARGYLKLERTAPLMVCPNVSVIIPVRDQPEDLLDCLKALEKVRYPKDRLEIIVVDDGSKEEVARIVSSENIRIIRHNESKGAAACRNIGAENAKGDIFAFLDADCVAGESWLEEIVSFFQSAGAGAAGGYIDGYEDKTSLDRYEKVFSSLNMGNRLIIEASGDSGFYVPTANLLVSREAFKTTGGFKEGMRVGEDVDFCWRLREHGFTLIYTPSGSVAHRHRNKLGRMLKRRAEYGTSEALLYRTHRDKKKGFNFAVLPVLSFIALTLAILLMNPYPLCALPLFFGIDMSMKNKTVKKYKMELPLRQIAAAALRSLLSFYYFAFFHLMRYYLVLIVGMGFAWWPFWVWGGAGLLYTSLTDYIVKKPQLFYLVSLFYYLLEHIVYQAGVFWGCVKYRYFGSYLIRFKLT
ncbi:MAG: mycofactocin system glycosyltransferase [Chloroflexi bacterium RBG_13_51_18]|nr:MAG: mycofactocin system glycosyltransferase [Chloroflexi bacterium RBG_13_51_18]